MILSAHNSTTSFLLVQITQPYLSRPWICTNGTFVRYIRVVVLLPQDGTTLSGTSSQLLSSCNFIVSVRSLL
jgi:hypothetical protein